jgi:hypothetical protein
MPLLAPVMSATLLFMSDMGGLQFEWVASVRDEFLSLLVLSGLGRPGARDHDRPSISRCTASSVASASARRGLSWMCCQNGTK